MYLKRCRFIVYKKKNKNKKKLYDRPLTYNITLPTFLKKCDILF